MARSSRFLQRGSCGSNHYLLQRQLPPMGNASNLHLHIGVGDSFSPAHGISASYHSLVRSLYIVVIFETIDLSF